MEEQTETTTKTETSPPASKFMDIQTPNDEQQPVDAESSESVAPESVSESGTPVMEPESPDEVALSPNETSVVSSDSEAPAEPAVTNIQVNDGDAKSTDAPSPEHASSDTTDSSENHPAEPVHPSHKSGAPLVAIVVAIVVALALSGVVIAMFLKSRNNSNLGGDTSSTNSKTTVAKPLASPEDVDQASSDVDKSLNSVNDDTDFAATDISDQSLGL